MQASKTDGTLWVWGNNETGQLAQNNANPAQYSSPTQIPGTDWTMENVRLLTHIGGSRRTV